MATKIYAHPFNYGTSSDILDFKTHSVRKRMPAWRECADPKPPFVTFGADAWNCAKCEGERPFALPVNTSDILQYQFQFDDSVNEDPANPVYGWQDSSSDDDPYYMKARILNCDCEAVESYNFIDDFSPVYGVAFDAVGGSFQYLQIDVGELPSDLCCFYIQIEHYVMVDDVLVNDQNIVSGPYQLNDLAGCACNPDGDSTLQICGSYKKADCWGRRYDIEFGGDTAATFSDCMRVDASIVYLGTTSESTFDGEVEVKTTQKNRYRIDIDGVPPMIAQWISNILASNGTLAIGEYTIDRGKGDVVGSFDRAINNLQMFHGSVEFAIVCEIENYGCN